MGKPTGFLEYKRENPTKRDPFERTKNWQEFQIIMPEASLRKQGSRCMDCGVPFCQTGTTMAGSGEIGCPVYNLIPEWNDLVYRGKWREALDRLHKTNNFPEFTGRVCPAPCEGSCTLAISDDAVSIKSIEYHIVERGFQEGWITPQPPKTRTGKKVAVVGSGPAGLAAAAQLNKAGHLVTVFEREDRIGGLLTYGIPDVKLANHIVERRVKLLEEEGILFKANMEVGKDITTAELDKEFDAVILCTGATKPRDVEVEGRELNGIHFAMDFLTANTKSLLNSNFQDQDYIDAKDKHVIVIGGGDTGTDCITTSVRHGAKSITQFDINKTKLEERPANNPWPMFPIVHTVDDGHKEAKAVYGNDPRAYQLMTTKFVGDENGNLKELHTISVETKIDENGQKTRHPIAGSEKVWPADLVLLAVGFTGPEEKIIQQLKLETDKRSNIKAEYGQYVTSVEGVYAAGDNRRGQSLVVWAIHEGREAARECDRYLMGASNLP
ncbi:glutamate synthase subunit beta [Alkalihalobacillus alcalophilus ATCC 27647 = CGMCC 1.3604]|uniref:Glutamate synthase n=1 Tax=Alkalihalobacillus alcalophilus ATCC 27647 = CGMCC 1.3604 TaxID=1218173 RepID=A0A094XJX3_ALKAL|nr:glutamate synthase subunit beta [Alkalihalobacillus alcalophilus]KGA99080.1 glutamate synthase [Alkalihalobacillus alcalophilus ATCC 27647 = CGMCC 1.3604]MED1562536.1 glutamate synthase subunit beta [Alkalihalobacillus alcalophilus]THG90113.1 glutamate synthase subunit beta [Alkalihalobacillus alcalophilus ATCC 27647 = CGMCC 1.3604]